MDYLTGSFAPLILLSPVLIALAVAIFFTYRLSARIAQRNAEEEQNRPRLKSLDDEDEEVALSQAEGESDVIGKLSRGEVRSLDDLDEKDRAELRSLIQKTEAMNTRSRSRREKDDEESDIESHGKSA